MKSAKETLREAFCIFLADEMKLVFEVQLKNLSSYFS